MKKILVIAAIMAPLLLTACHESLEDRAAREAQEYTHKFCPTPSVNGVRTDSITFEKATRTLCYYYTAEGPADNEELIAQRREEISDDMLRNIRENTSLKAYRKEKFSFRHVMYSTLQPGKVLFEANYVAEDYN